MAGVSLTFTDETIAGQASTCAHWSYHGTQATYCVTSTGVLAKVESCGSSGGSQLRADQLLQLAPGFDFAVPQGATVVTLPTGASTP